MNRRRSIPKKFSSTFISKEFFPEDYQAKNLSCINYGRCYDWAYIAHCLYPESNLWMNNGHAWIEINGKFYDSETCRGVKDPNKIRSNSTASYWRDRPDEKVDVVFFKNFWNKYGGGRTHHWKQLQFDIKTRGFEFNNERV